MGDEKIFTVILRDITDSKSMEFALRQAHDQLEERVKERTVELESANNQLQQEISDRVRTEEALKESQTRMVGILDWPWMPSSQSITNNAYCFSIEPPKKCLVFRLRMPSVDHWKYLYRNVFVLLILHISAPSEMPCVTTRAMAGSRAVYGLRADGQEFPLEASISQMEAGCTKTLYGYFARYNRE